MLSKYLILLMVVVLGILTILFVSWIVPIAGEWLNSLIWSPGW